MTHSAKPSAFDNASRHSETSQETGQGLDPVVPHHNVDLQLIHRASLSSEFATRQAKPDHTIETPRFIRSSAAEFWAMVDNWERRQPSLNDGGLK
jgi:hypothetical protein